MLFFNFQNVMLCLITMLSFAVASDEVFSGIPSEGNLTSTNYYVTPLEEATWEETLTKQLVRELSTDGKPSNELVEKYGCSLIKNYPSSTEW